MPKAGKQKRRAVVSAPRHAPAPRLQVAALCWRRSAKGLRILLITSRDTGRWVIPKGWPMKNRTDAGAAAREAYEEAGLRGIVSERSIGVYTYRKALSADQRILVAVRVFPLEAREMLRKYPETGQRQIKWLAPAVAARRVVEPELKALIREFDPDATHDAAPDAEPAPDAHPVADDRATA